jgi:hypothetical protein
VNHVAARESEADLASKQVKEEYAMPNNNPTGVGGFSKGRSGNPGGLKHKHVSDLSKEARRYASLAVSTLVKICRKGMERNQLAAARELLDRGYGRPLQMIDASMVHKKLSELTPDEIAALEARILTNAATDPEAAEPDLFRNLDMGTAN